VAVGGIKIGVEGGQIEVDMPWHVGAIDDTQNPSSPGPFDDFGNREDEGCGRGDMANRDGFGVGGDTCPEVLDERFGSSHGDWYFTVDDFATVALEVVFPGVVDGAVFMVGGEDFIIGTKAQRINDDIHAVGNIGHKHHIIGIGIDKFTESGPRFGAFAAIFGVRQTAELLRRGLAGEFLNA
jgi:hypothetical protein